MTIHESSCRKSGSGYGPVLPGACAPAIASNISMPDAAMPTLTMSMPDVLRKSRRSDMRHRLSGHHSRRALDGELDAVVRHAAAQVAIHLLADLCVGRIRVPVEQRLRRHDLPVLTEAARGHLLVDPRLLNGMERTVRREAF